MLKTIPSLEKMFLQLEENAPIKQLRYDELVYDVDISNDVLQKDDAIRFLRTPLIENGRFQTGSNRKDFCQKLCQKKIICALFYQSLDPLKKCEAILGSNE